MYRKKLTHVQIKAYAREKGISLDSEGLEGLVEEEGKGGGDGGEDESIDDELAWSSHSIGFVWEAHVVGSGVEGSVARAEGTCGERANALPLGEGAAEKPIDKASSFLVRD